MSKDKKPLTVVLSPKEFDEIKQAADNMSLPMSTYMRMIALQAMREARG